MRELSRRGIHTVGGGRDVSEACRPVRFQVGSIQVAVVAYLAMKGADFFARPDQGGAASWEECQGDVQLAQLALEADLVLLALHLHLAQGWTAQVPAEHIDWVRHAMAAGADIVIGHGSHVLQGIIQSGDRLGFLSLGNFLFRPGYRMSERAHRSVVAMITVAAGTVNVALAPLRLDDSGRPRIPQPDDGSRILQGIAHLSSAFGTRVEIRDGIGHITVRRRTPRSTRTH